VIVGCNVELLPLADPFAQLIGLGGVVGPLIAFSQVGIDDSHAGVSHGEVGVEFYGVAEEGKSLGWSAPLG